MGMFDYYRPMPERHCPVCRRRLSIWQGKDGPNGLFVWVEGVQAPVDQLVDEDAQIGPDAREGMRLPPCFTIYSHDCPEHQPVEAQCGASGGVWTETVLLPFKDRTGRRPNGT
jgi:hypothetical protein